MKLANQILNKNEDQESADKAARGVFDKSIGKDLRDALGKKDSANFISNLIQYALDFDEINALIAALKKAKSAFDKEAVEERQNQNIKVRGVTEGFGSRKARLTIKEAINMMDKLADKKAGAPNPKYETDMVHLKEAKAIAQEAMKKLRPIKENKKGY